MGDGTKIEWADASWNPIRGCTRVSEGCRHCYAERQAFRFSGPGQPYEGLIKLVGDEPRWTGDVTLVGSALEAPRRWQRRRRVFVDSMGDLFHDRVPDLWIDKCFAVMAGAGQHVFIVLTKRHQRMRAYMEGLGTNRAAYRTKRQRIPYALSDLRDGGDPVWPLPNVWLGVSIEDQATADERIPELLATPAAVRIVSAEPLLELVDLTELPAGSGDLAHDALRGRVHGRIMWPEGPSQDVSRSAARLDGVIVGGESGPGARPMHPDWARSLRDQCGASAVAFFFKQWGEWAHEDQRDARGDLVGNAWSGGGPDGDGGVHHWPDGTISIQIRKRHAGRLLDGREHSELPAHA